MSRVAIFTDSASDLDPADAAASGIRIVPLIVSFGNETFKAGVELSGPAFWERMVAPDAPFPTTAASSPGDFKAAYEAAFAAGAEAIVSIHLASTLSGTIKSAQIARDMLPDREIHVVDSLGASMAEGILARMGVEMAEADRPAAEIAETLEIAGVRHADLRGARDPRVPEEGRPDQRCPGGDRNACCRSSRSSRSGTARSPRPSGCGRGPRRVSG